MWRPFREHGNSQWCISTTCPLTVWYASSVNFVEFQFVDDAIHRIVTDPRFRYNGRFAATVFASKCSGMGPRRESCYANTFLSITSEILPQWFRCIFGRLGRHAFCIINSEIITKEDIAQSSVADCINFACTKKKHYATKQSKVCNEASG